MMTEHSEDILYAPKNAYECVLYARARIRAISKMKTFYIVQYSSVHRLVAVNPAYTVHTSIYLYGTHIYTTLASGQ